MKPQNKQQEKIIELSNTLPGISQEQKNHALTSIHKKYVSIAYTNKHFCLSCGEKWSGNGAETKKNKSCSCPKCGEKLKFDNIGKYYNDRWYYQIVTTHENMQVVRIFISDNTLTRGKKSIHSMQEVVQHWIGQDGKKYTIMAPRNDFGYYYDNWRHGALEFRTKSKRFNLCSKIYVCKTYPKVKVLPILKRNGFKRGFHGMLPQDLFVNLLKDNKIETLYKAKQFNLVEKTITGDLDVKKLWSSLKIVIKTDYKISNIKDWKDYVDLLEYFGKDLKNPKYVCPDNLNHEHNKLVNKKRRILQAQKIEELKAEMQSAQLIYEEEKKRFFEFKIQSKNLTIEPLKKVEDFLKDGDTLNHCIFTNEYYKEKDSLILRAVYKNEVVETIEVSLVNFQIKQARGLENKPTKHNKKIISLVEKNMNRIQNLTYKQAS